jgi:hypothetical protein
MVSVAVFLALGGGAYAASSFIGADGKLHGCVSKNGQLTVVKPGKSCSKGTTSITWNKEGPAGQNGQQGIQGIQGIQGGQGDQGAPGPPSPAQVVVRRQAIPANVGAQAATVSCNSGEYAMSGGFETSTDTTVHLSRPNPSGAGDHPTGWYFNVSYPGGTDGNGYFWVVCVKP